MPKIESNKRNYIMWYLQTAQISFPGNLQVQCYTPIFNLYKNRKPFTIYNSLFDIVSK